MGNALRWVRYAAVALVVVAVLGVAAVAALWQVRQPVESLDWPVAVPSLPEAGAVTVTWLGISTLLFDDGETQIITDATFTRLSMLDIFLLRPVATDVAMVNYALAEYRVDRLAAIVPVHSHFDHAMDIGFVANRTTAVILGSESSANIARGANVPVDQYQILADGESRQFGQFTVTLVASKHAPIGFGDNPWFPGTIDQPLYQPARVSAWRTGTAYSIFISHPRGTTMIQGSGGYIEGNLDGQSADVVMLGIAGLTWLGRDYVDRYWEETVRPLAPSRIFPIHLDDFSKPFGEFVLFPDIFDNVVKTAGWIDELAAAETSLESIELLPFGEPITLY